jgi:hypothetical protein
MFSLLASSALASFVQPASVTDFRKYLVGDWELKKRFTYKGGGISGRFDGTASFADASTASSSLLTYNESGTFAPSEPNFQSRETANRLLYLFADDVADIYFSPQAFDSSSSVESLLSQAQYLYPLRSRGEPGVLSIDHSADDGHTYTGTIEVDAPHAFIYSWRVRGPTQQGEIISLFKRESASGSEDGVIEVDAL